MRKSVLFCVALLTLAFGINAQAQTVSGKVTSSEDNSGLPGVNVLIKGTTTGVVTDIDGNYRIQASSSDVLVFSYVGYLTQELPVGNQSVINVSMESDVETLGEIVVTGYASQQKKDLTGSVGVVEPKELVAQPTGNVTSQLQGRVSGVTVTGSGQPGAGSKVRIRGISSFSNNDPLYVVDGVPTFDASTLNPNDIESISILKDAGSASIYGSRATNGVIVVTTKKGKKGGVKLNYNSYVGTQDPGNGPKGLLDTQGYADLQFLVYNNDGTNEVHPIYGPSPAAGGTSPQLPSWAANTDWYDVFTDAAAITNHDLTLSGGNDHARFFGGFGWFRQNGIVKHTYTQRFNLRFNSDFTVANDRLKFGENLTVSRRNGNGVTNLAEGSPIQMGSYRTQPIIPPIITTPITGISHNFVPGEFGGTGIAPRLGNGDNVLATLTRDKDDTNFDIRILGSAYMDVKIIDGLNFRTTFGGTMANNYWTNWTSKTYESAENVGTSSFSEGANYNNDWVWTNTLTFNKQIGADHNILAVVGYESVKTGIGRNVFGARAGYFSDAVSFRTLGNGATIQDTNSGSNTPSTLVSQFVRADYSFRNKYLLSATFRRDGSSKFASDTRYGTFPSVTAGWRIGDEAFMSGLTFVSDLKIRGGYGTMGNQLPASPINQFTLFGGSPSTSNYDINGTGTSSAQGFRPTSIGNTAGQWETQKYTNIGFDAGLLDNKFQVTFDWYHRTTDRLLVAPELPGTAGAASPPAQNIGSMKNTGIDAQVIYKNQWGDFGFEGNLTFTTYNNEITKVFTGTNFFDAGGSRIGSFSRNQVGQPMGSFFGYQVMGLFQSASEVSGAPTQDGAEAGFFRFQDTNGDGAITPDDRTFIGNPNPDFTFGLNLSLTYKNFDITTFLYSSQGNDIFNWNLWWVDFWPSFQGQKSTNLLNNSWTPSNTGATTPKASNTSNFSTNTQSTSYYIEDGSFIRMKNLQIGYSLPQNLLNSMGFTSFRVYLQGVNLFTITDYTGLDPELTGPDSNFGIDRGNYPNVKQYLIGVNIGI